MVFVKTGTLKCARLEFSGCRVKPRRLRGRQGFTQQQPENSKRAHLTALALPNTTRKPRGRGKKREILGPSGPQPLSPHASAPHPLGPHPLAPSLRAPTFSGFGPSTLRTPPFGARFFLFLGPTLWGHDTHQIQQWIGQNWISLSSKRPVKSGWPKRDSRSLPTSRSGIFIFSYKPEPNIAFCPIFVHPLSCLNPTFKNGSFLSVVVL